MKIIFDYHLLMFEIENKLKKLIESVFWVL